MPKRKIWGQVIVALLLAALGFAAAVQVRARDPEGLYPGARRSELVQLLDSLDAANLRAGRQIAELEATKRELQTSTNATQTAQQEAREEATTLAILAGTVAATGPGVAIEIEDQQGSISAATMLNAVEELRDAGAEAIEVNNTARIVAQTYFADSDGSIIIDGAPVRPPYLVEAIGSPQTLSVAVSFPGGLADEVEALGGSASVAQQNAIDITALSQQRAPEYAQPAP